ncbi:MAG TPA: FGGY-family carbohydrate kinase [Planctomycetota bacterium]|jgi:xylulokinase|nr:carbohydrate kinase [Planctomycetota bacterium]OQC21879.1 MAG: Xylulose kinase [Planctomycetes bacterium ADurb.Bin069]HNR98170.1 FGGY-family carbohydrate kinase [Planctomycetota bacterium]HNU27365.1 FGGY-family carbohydrate kinase [Planctomycetota bacterium]HOE29563.1 FGGY-family carbohydrate kinase [Planctomycetota bacterium]
MAIYLGLDSSTQSLTAVAIEIPARKILGAWSVNFAARLPAYGTENGVLRGADPRVAHSPPLMWVEALDLLLADMAAAKFPFAEVAAIAGSGQQHGSVYLLPEAERLLAGLGTAPSLAEGFAGAFARPTSPIWMDSSTAAECAAITAALGGAAAVAELTGSAAFERFTGPQIRKFHATEPERYERTWRIHLVSSFMASVLAGKSAPIDPGDGAGMNLMNIRTRAWAPAALEAAAPGLAAKLPPIAPSDEVFGAIAPYFAARYGFAPGAKLLPWSGDNPCSLIGVGLVQTGKVAVSLGTSDTYFGFMPEARVDPRAEGHVFGSPTGHYMSLICFKNGSLAREAVRDGFGMDWAAFSAQIEAAPPGNLGRVMLPYFDPEITPKALDPGVRRYRLAPGDRAAARAVVEAQALSMAVHSEWMGAETASIYATGGASRNRTILQIFADVHGADVYQFEVSASAALGAALRAFHGERKAAGAPLPWPEVVQGFTAPVPASRIAPRREYRERYAELKRLYRMCEEHTLAGGPDPSAALAAFGKKYPA